MPQSVRVGPGGSASRGTSPVTWDGLGIGDVAITDENEVILGQQRGDDFELVIPHSTILIETPVAVVDANVDKHGKRAAAEAFVNFLFMGLSSLGRVTIRVWRG